MQRAMPNDGEQWRERFALWLRTWTWEGLGGVRVLIVGSIVATITILLLQRLSDVGLPITIDVKDWIGGLIVGLFSSQLGDSLYKRFLAEDAAPAPPKKTPPP